MLILIVISYSIFLFLSFFATLFPDFYLSELTLSFLPYILCFSFIGLVGSIIYAKNLAKKNKHKIGLLFRIFILLSGLVFFLFSKKFSYFYNVDIPQIQENMTGWLKILYANVYKDNTNYSGLIDLIEDEDPDLLMFVEFADHHHLGLKEILDEKYPYTNATYWSKSFVWNMVFSKNKIDNWADDFPQWAWRYAYFSVDYNWKPVYFYLLHMSSPISWKYFDMRNKQIQQFFDGFSLHQENHRIHNDKVVAVWDFNTSPWSRYYWNFAKWFEWEFINLSRSLPITFTWRSNILPIVWSHIDHVFINKFVESSSLSVISIPGSDHRGFLFSIR